MEGGLIGAYCFPHGAITLDPQTRDFTKNTPALKSDTREQCLKLHEAMRAQAQILIQQKPDLIILSSPHGVKLGKQYLFIGNSWAKGSAEWDGEWTDFTAAFDIETNLTSTMANKLKEMGNPTEILTMGNPGAFVTKSSQVNFDPSKTRGDPIPLRWGEVIPWYFIEEAAKEAGQTLPHVIYIGHHIRAPMTSGELIQEVIKLGHDIGTLILQEPGLASKRVALVVSSDLSHYHSKDPTSPYAYNPACAPFDDFINIWAQNDYGSGNPGVKGKKALIDDAGGILEEAGSCGYTGLVLLHGILETICKDESKGLKYRASVLAQCVPTYYGMMVNHWIREETQ